MAEAWRKFRDINALPINILGKKIADLSCYHAILQKLGVHLYTDIRGEEGNWERLAEELGISTYNEVENIHRHASLEKIFPGSVLLKRWGENPGSTVYVLLQALKKLGREDCVDDVCSFLEDENNMELHVSIEDEAGVKEFITVKTKKDATLGSSVENALGGLVCYEIIGPDTVFTWQSLAVQLKGKQLSIKKVPFDDNNRFSIYGGSQPDFNYRFPEESSFNFPQYPTNIPIGNTSLFHQSYPSACGLETNISFHNYLDENATSQTPEKQIDGFCSSLTPVKLLENSEYSVDNRRVLNHSKSIEDHNFQSLTEVKVIEKNIIKDLDCDQLKKCNSMSDINYDMEPLKKFDSVTSMDMSDGHGGCSNFHCGAEKCTHSLVWQDGQLKNAYFSNESLDISQDSTMDTCDSLEICTLPSQCLPIETDYIPHSFVVSRRTSSDLNSPVSPVNSPPKCTEHSSSTMVVGVQKPCDKGNSLLRTALRRSFEKKTNETQELPAPKPCKTAPPQQNEAYLASVVSESDDSNHENSSVISIEEELSKRPPQCRLPVASDGYIPMDSHRSCSDRRPSSLPLDSTNTYINMAGSSTDLARRPLPPRPRDSKSSSATTNLIHSHSVGDMIVITPDNEYCYISDDDKSPSSSQSSSPPLPAKRTTGTHTISITRSQSTTAIADMSNVPGWCSSITESNVSAVMHKYKNEDGNFMVWKMKDNTFVITVSHLRDLRHYAIHCRNINGQMNYYIFNGGYMTTSVVELLHFYQREGLKGPDPMLDGSRGKKWQKYSHVKLKHPMKSRNSVHKNND